VTIPRTRHQNGTEDHADIEYDCLSHLRGEQEDRSEDDKQDDRELYIAPARAKVFAEFGEMVLV